MIFRACTQGPSGLSASLNHTSPSIVARAGLETGVALVRREVQVGLPACLDPHRRIRRGEVKAISSLTRLDAERVALGKNWRADGHGLDLLERVLLVVVNHEAVLQNR